MKGGIIIYHISDPDGIGASWSAWLKLKNKAKYLGFDYLNNLPLNFNNETIYFLDVSPSIEKIKILKAKNNKIVLIDHHLSSFKLKDLVDEFVVDMNHSAAVLTFKYFFPDQKVPKLLKYIEDQDLWQFKLPFSKKVNIVIDLLKPNFKKWSEFAKRIENNKEFKKIVSLGEKLLIYEDYLINQIIQKATLVEFEGYKVLAVNSPVLISEVGNALYQKRPPFSIVYSINGRKKKISLRSDQTVDVSKIAEKYGGGGREGAASFVLDINQDWPWKLIQ